jgi:hypothetical protein
LVNVEYYVIFILIFLQVHKTERKKTLLSNKISFLSLENKKVLRNIRYSNFGIYQIAA